jgi:hypothetical protein
MIDQSDDLWHFAYYIIMILSFLVKRGRYIYLFFSFLIYCFYETLNFSSLLFQQTYFMLILFLFVFIDSPIFICLLCLSSNLVYQSTDDKNHSYSYYSIVVALISICRWFVIVLYFFFLYFIVITITFALLIYMLRYDSFL